MKPHCTRNAAGEKAGFEAIVGCRSETGGVDWWGSPFDGGVLCGQGSWIEP